MSFRPAVCLFQRVLGAPLLHRLYMLLRYEQARLSEFNVATGCLIWGFVFLNPLWRSYTDTYIQTSAVPYSCLNDLAPIWLWGCAMLWVGLLWHYGLSRGSQRIRRYASFSSLLIWLFGGMLVIADAYTHIMAWTMFIFAWASALAHIRLGSILRKNEGSDGVGEH